MVILEKIKIDKIGWKLVEIVNLLVSKIGDSIIS